MAFNDLEKQRIKNLVGAYTLSKAPAHIRKQLRFDYEIRGQEVILVEIRPSWSNESEEIHHEYAKVKYVRTQDVWKLYWKRASGKWNLFEPASDFISLEKAINEIEADRYCCFYG